MSNQTRSMQLLTAIVSYAIFLVVFLLVIYPMIWMFYTSFKEQWQIFENPFALPGQLNMTNYVKAWTIGNFNLYFMNSVIITLPSVLGILLISSLAAYAFARFRFKGDRHLFLFFLIGIMVPSQAIVIPAFQIVSSLGLINSYLALIFTYFSWCPVAIFILTTFFKGLPIEIEDAAKIDGAGHLGIFWWIALPLARPALATVAIFYFVWVWNDFMYPLLYLQLDTLSTIPLGLMLFNGRWRVDWGMQTAALSIASFMPILFYMIFQDKFVRGLTAGAVKG
ncbi:carbohydrate ABC transporter permease [Chloroflexi bacterium TSY]|nr:carbohydrate ABC transporter permease [Chloroflexi bacterium TSY]